MSALFPNVPNLPGVPPVARAAASLSTMLAKSSTAETSARSALSALVGNNLGAATASLTAAHLSATDALGLAGPIFSNGSDVIGSLGGTIDNAGAGLLSIATGDIGTAIANTQRAISEAVRSVGSISDVISPIARTLLGGAGLLANADSSTQWGLYTQDGALAIEPDNIVVFENTLDSRISTYPIEKGGFGSYNKVIVPFNITLVMSTGGTVEDRQEFLKDAQKAQQGTELFNVVTPTGVYLDMNVIGLRQSAASDRGANLMTLELALEKVRQTATLTFTNTTKQPTGAAPVNNGSVQTKPPPIDSSLAGAPQ